MKLPKFLLFPLLHYAKVVPLGERHNHDKRKWKLSFGPFDFAVYHNDDHAGTKFLITHFSVNGPYRGSGIGEHCLRSFAIHISNQHPTVDEIGFNIWQAPTKADHALLAQKRHDLLVQIGVINATIHPPAKGRGIHQEVTGRWLRKDWAKP